MRKRLLKIAESLLGCPTAPFREHPVREYIREFCKVRGIATRQDNMGNIIATYGTKYRNMVFAFGAHMDHPGFIIEKDSNRKKTTALFYGRMDEEYFKAAEVRIFNSDREVTGRVTKTQFNLKKRIKRAYLELDGEVKKGDIAMWNLVPYKVKADKLYSRACDDCVGCVSILAFFDQLVRKRVKKKVMGIFTVAEECGFHGAKYLCIKKQIPKKTNIITIETSRELPIAKIGDGAVIRVGDRLNIFTPAMTRFMVYVAKRIKARNKNFKYQRKLMDGGTCESSVYQAFGYTNGALCIALGNYHNRNFSKKKIEAEYVSVNDLENMVELFLGFVRHSKDLVKFTRESQPKYTEERRPLGERLFF